MPAPQSARRSPGRLELDVHAALVAAGPDGATAADVIASVDPSLAYTTVVTTLARLVERGVISRRRVGRAAVFTTVGEPGAVVATSTARRMNRLLAATPDRTGVLTQFVAGLSPEDEARLAGLLARADEPRVTWALALPVVAGVLLGLAGAPVSRRLGPRATARLFPVTALLVAVSTVVAVAAVAVLVLARVAEVAEVGQLSVPALPAGPTRVPLPVGLALGVAVAVSLWLAARRVVGVVAGTVEAQRVCRHLARRADGVHLLDDDRPRAFAVAGPTGRVVVSSGMLRSLSAPHQAAVLAHERSHLRRRHHLGLLAVGVAAAADPLLRPLVALTALAVERDADEDAAVAVGDRRVVASALARAGLAGAAADRGPAGAAGLGAAVGHVPLRVEALLAPAVRPDRWLAVPVVGLALVASWATWVNGMTTDHSIDRARAAYTPAAHSSAATAEAFTPSRSGGPRAGATASPGRR